MKTYQILSLALGLIISSTNAAPLGDATHASLGCPYTEVLCAATCSNLLRDEEISYTGRCGGDFNASCLCVFYALPPDGPVLGKPTRTVIYNPPALTITRTQYTTAPPPTATPTRTTLEARDGLGKPIRTVIIAPRQIGFGTPPIRYEDILPRHEDKIELGKPVRDEVIIPRGDDDIGFGTPPTRYEPIVPRHEDSISLGKPIRTVIISPRHEDSIGFGEPVRENPIVPCQVDEFPPIITATRSNIEIPTLAPTVPEPAPTPITTPKPTITSKPTITKKPPTITKKSSTKKTTTKKTTTKKTTTKKTTSTKATPTVSTVTSTTSKIPEPEPTYEPSSSAPEPTKPEPTYPEPTGPVIPIPTLSDSISWTVTRTVPIFPRATTAPEVEDAPAPAPSDSYTTRTVVVPWL